MDIIYMLVEIILVSNNVIPKAMLPDPASSTANPTVVGRRKREFDSLHDFGEIFPFGLNYRMKMIRQNYPGNYLEGKFAFCSLERLKEKISVVKENCGTLIGDIRDKIQTPGSIVASQVRHVSTIAPWRAHVRTTGVLTYIAFEIHADSTRLFEKSLDRIDDIGLLLLG